MTKYQIENTSSAIVLGIVEADTEQQALDKLAVRAGYKDHAEVEELIQTKAGEILVTDIDGDIQVVADFIIDGIKKNKDYNDGDYRGWDTSTAREVYCDFDLVDEDEMSDEQNRVQELLDSSDEFAGWVDSVVDSWLVAAVSHEEAGLSEAVRKASSLSALQEALKAADDYADEHGLEKSELYDATNLPVFGDDEITDTDDVFSWDDDSYMDGQWNIHDRD